MAMRVVIVIIREEVLLLVLGLHKATLCVPDPCSLVNMHGYGLFTTVVLKV